MASFVRRLTQRKIAQWAIAYVAGAWLLVEVLGFVAENFGWPAGIVRGAAVFLGVGFFVALVLAWYHGEKGQQRATGFELLIITGLLLVAGAAAAYVSRGSAPEEAETGAPPTLAIGLRSVAVLPLVNRSAVQEDEFFVQGIHDDILTQLSKINSLTVISRTSVMQYAGTTKPMREIAGELGVAAVLEGGVQRAGDRVRVNVQLIDAGSDAHLWAETYDEELTAANIFSIQSDIARKIAAALQAMLAPEVEGRLEALPTESLEAYELYVRGRQLWHSRASLDRASDYFARAIDLDPNYALAHSGLAATYVLLPNYGYNSPSYSYPLAIRYAQRALALDSTLAEPYATLAQVKYVFEWDWDAADRLFRRAIGLSPNYANGHYWYAYFLFRRGRVEEALAVAEVALALDPLSPSMEAGIAGRLYNIRRFDEAAGRLRRVLAEYPNHPAANLWSGAVLVATGDYEEGVAALERGASLAPKSMSSQTILAAGYASAGEGTRARELLKRLEADDTWRRASPVWIAAAYAQLGEADRAFDWLERALEERDNWLMNIRTEPLIDPLRADERFVSIVRRVGLDLE